MVASSDHRSTHDFLTVTMYHVDVIGFIALWFFFFAQTDLDRQWFSAELIRFSGAERNQDHSHPRLTLGIDA
ncbi:MAG: hypothetical protein WCT12_17555 [Verrucomicrobiota bacterium]